MKKLISFVTGAVFLLSAVAPAVLAAEADAEEEAVQTVEMAEVEVSDTEDLTPVEQEEDEMLSAMFVPQELSVDSNTGVSLLAASVDDMPTVEETPLLKRFVVSSDAIIKCSEKSPWWASCAFDGKYGYITSEGNVSTDNNFFESDRGQPWYVGADFNLHDSTPKYIRKIRYLPRFEFADRMNDAWFEGSNDGVTYTPICEKLSGHRKDNQNKEWDGPNGWFTIDLPDNTTAYRYVRLRREQVVNVSEIEFYIAAGADYKALELISKIDTLIVNDGPVKLPSLNNADYDLSYAVLSGDEVASVDGNTVTYTASQTNNVSVELGVMVTSKTDETDVVTLPVNIMVERARTAAERVADDKELTENLDITVYSEDDKEIVYLLPKISKYRSTLTWDFNEEFVNTYGDTITDFDSKYYKLTVDPGANKYLAREIDITAVITYGDESDTVDRTITVNPLVTKNIGGHTFHFKQIEGQPIGNLKGGVEIRNEQILLSGIGEDMWNSPDTCGYFYKKTSAENLSISVKIDQTSAGTNRYRSFGLMFRNTDDPNARMVMLAIGPDGGGRGLTLTTRKGATYPVFTEYQNDSHRGTRTFGVIKLEKKGSRFRAYYSADEGQTFTELTSKSRTSDVNLALDGEYCVGLYAASNIEEPTYFSRLEIDGDDVFAANDIKDVKLVSGNKKINVTWTDPTEQDIRTFDKIAVTCTDGKEFTEVKEVEKGVQTAAFDNLVNGTEYTVSVQAKSAEIRNGAVPGEIKAYHAYSAPITETSIPLDVSEFQTNKPKVNVSATTAKVGQKSEVSLSFEKPLPIYRMSLDVKTSDGLMVTLNDITLSDSLKAAGATVDKTDDGFKISYSAKGGKAINLSDIAQFGAGSLTAGEKTVSVSGNLVFCTQESGEVSISPSENSKGSVTFAGGTSSSGGSGSSGGGRGGAGYGGGSTPKAPKPTYTPGSEDNKPATDSVFVDEQDIPDWAKIPVLELAKRGIISGSPSGNGYVFNPSGRVTREQFIKMCVTAFAEVDDSASCEFTDVSPNEWYYPYVATAAKLGITSGMGDGRFGVDEPITRQDMAVLLHRMVSSGYAELKNKAEEIEFSDYAEVEDYAKDAVRAMQKAGVINGYEDGRFAPNDAATRDMVAKMIYNILVGGAE